MVTLEFSNIQKAPIAKRRFEKVVKTFFRLQKVSGKNSITVAVVGEREMRTLNRKYRRKDKATDVLSFSERDTKSFPHEQKSLGQIIICFPYAKRQAKDMGHSVSRELDRLLVHGLAHIMGFTHYRKKETEKMQKLETEVLEKLRKK